MENLIPLIQNKSWTKKQRNKRHELQYILTRGYFDHFILSVLLELKSPGKEPKPMILKPKINASHSQIA